MHRIRHFLAACAALLLAACASTGPAGEGNALEWIKPSTAGQCNQAYEELLECRNAALDDGKGAILDKILTPILAP